MGVATAQFQPEYERANAFGIIPLGHEKADCKYHKFCSHSDSAEVSTNNQVPLSRQKVHTDSTSMDDENSTTFLKLTAVKEE